MKIKECFYSVPAESMFDHETNSLDHFIDKIKLQIDIRFPYLHLSKGSSINDVIQCWTILTPCLRP